MYISRVLKPAGDQSDTFGTRSGSWSRYRYADEVTFASRDRKSDGIIREVLSKEAIIVVYYQARNQGTIREKL